MKIVGLGKYQKEKKKSPKLEKKLWVNDTLTENLILL